MDDLSSTRLLLRPPQPGDAAPLLRLLREPEVARWWPGFTAQQVWDDFIVGDDDATVLVIEHAASAEVCGLIQFSEVVDPMYRHAGLDLFLGSAFQGQGLGVEAIRAVLAYLIDVRGHHRFVIDPAADNTRAQRAYEKVGFRRVGVLREYERGPDGSFHDGLLMELLAREFVR